MRKILFFTLSLLLSGGAIHAQSPTEIANSASSIFDNPSGLNLNLGAVNIDGETHIGIRFQPEISIGKFGAGLNVPVLYNLAEGKIRTEEYKDGVAWLRMIDYLCWGKKKKDPLYIRAGRLTGAYLGFGILMNNFTNSISFEKRTIGAEFDFTIGELFGMEGMYSDFDPSSFNLIALRPYVKPLAKTDIPILKTLEVGVGVVADFDQTDSYYVNEQNDTISTNSYLKEGMSGLSADLGLFLINNDMLTLTTYAQYGRLFKNQTAFNQLSNLQNKSSIIDSLLNQYGDGHGVSVGVAARLNLLFKTLQLNARLERLWYTNYFIPQFFDYQYAVNKNARIESLAMAEEMQGIYGSLVFNMIDKIFVGGGVLIPDQIDDRHPASAFVNVDIPDLLPKFYLSGRYFRGNIRKLEDVLKLDDQSQANAILAYKILPFLLAGVDYKWTFIQSAEKGLKIEHQVMPYIGFNYPLNFNN